MRDYRHIEVRIAGPVVAVRFGVDDVAQLAVFGDLGLNFTASLGLCGVSISTTPSLVVTKP